MKVDQIVADDMREWASFDIFETLIFRRFGSPSGVFMALGRMLARDGVIRISPSAFARQRAEAERRAFANSGGLDTSVDLDRIYGELRWALGLSEEQAQRCRDTEFALEAALLRHPPRSKALLADIDRLSEGVALISDTYFKSDELQNLLAAAGVDHRAARVFASCETQKSKHSGAAFPMARTALKANRLRHTGDNARSDVKSARRHGVDATHFAEGNLTRYEQCFADAAFDTGGLGSALAGASRLARLSLPAASPEDAAMRDFACDIVAPMAIAAALWTLTIARNEGVKRLYFAARDGQQVALAAGILSRRLGWDIDVRYLYCSRQAWLGAAIGAGARSFAETAFAKRDRQVSVRTGLARVSVEPEALGDVLARAGYGPSDWDRLLTLDECEALGRFLATDDAAASALAQLCKPMHDDALAYLEQEGLLDGTPYGFFDLGMNLTMIRLLDAIVPEDLRAKISLNAGRKLESLGDGRKGLYFLMNNGGMGTQPMRGAVTFFELILCADHATTIGYRREDDKIVPVLKDDPNVQRMIEWGVPAMSRAVEAVAEELPIENEMTDACADLRTPLFRALALFWKAPTRSEAALLARFPFEDGWGNESETMAISSPLGAWETIEALVRGTYKNRTRHHWRAGSAALSPRWIRSISDAQILTRMLRRRGLRPLLRDIRNISRAHVSDVEFN
ncbi:MAG: hypothetical protein AAGG56_11715 [Pseudomonadota bacterium]